MTELKNSMESFKSINRLDRTEERIICLENKTLEITQSDKQKQKE